MEPQACDVVVVVLSQTDSHHIDLAQQLKADIHTQALAVSQDVPVVHLAHEEFSHPGTWTVVPILPKLRALHGDNSSWIFFCEEHTKINLPYVLRILEKHDPNELVWVGHAIYDREATIIHHFAFFENPQHFKYPSFASGFAMTSTLLRRLSAQVLEYGASTDFSIDPAHELALFIWNNGKGPRITHVPHLCLQNNEDCASYPMPFTPCSDPVSKKSIYFAVKTCGKFHHDRIPVIKKTWAKYVLNIGFYSEVTDNSIPTIDLGVPNTERGHCGKTFAILKHVASHVKKHPEIKWIVVVDDDTILSVTRLQQLLSCYDPKIMTAIGERYGYNVQHSDQGYNYITGGGGMVFSTNLIQAIVKSEQCQCPSNSTPDDMFLGICLSSLNVPITHSPLFHQARPSDYAPEYLTTQVPVSFHKHWMIDPLKVYKKWFAEADKQFEEVIQNKHVEL
ncbi:Uncharacterized protein GBIM_15415 [Gryllus bimaculatus]|nr:Uncharacterized protein GBIM_15415 [Gryllus bimaculatus]